jgi:hypothetical protein
MNDVAQVFHSFAEQQPQLIGIENDPDIAAAAKALCARPELKPLLRGIRLKVLGNIGPAFHVLDAATIVLARTALDNPPLAAFHLRHALELALWQRALNGTLDDIARVRCAIAAFHCALAYLEMMTSAEKQRAERDFPPWLRAARQSVQYSIEAGFPAQEMAAVIGRYLPELLKFQGFPPEAAARVANEAVAAPGYVTAGRTLGLAMPCEHLLSLGGDTRLAVDEDTVLNQYGCSPRPRPWAITFASCTATSASDLAYAEAERLRQAMLVNALEGSLDARLVEEMERVRADLASTLQLPRESGVEIVLTSSGTDAEFYALYFALAGRHKPVTNILVAPNEVGKGTMPAAAGLHFDSLTPFGGEVEPGTPVQGFPAELVDVRWLHVREDSGAEIAPALIDAKLAQLTASAVAEGRTALVHLVDSSKTGLHAPSDDAVASLQREHGNAVLVLVDAAQMRIGRAALRAYLEQGCMILVTGSKFFTGAPFCGALLIPAAIAADIKGSRPMPHGFSSYSSRSDFPPSWSQRVMPLSPQPNLGLLMRWRAALWEMRAFFAVPRGERHATIRAFGDAMVEAISTNPNLRLAAAPPRDRGGAFGDGNWDELPTIFTFFVLKNRRPNGAPEPLDYEQAWSVHRWLNTNIARALPREISPREREIAAKRCHIGQPVRLMKDGANWRAALRLAAGARLVSGVQFDPLLGDTRAARLAAEIRDARLVLEKISLIVRHWDAIAAAQAPAQTKTAAR